MLFQLQVNLQGTAPRRLSSPRPDLTPEPADDIDSALDSLQTRLEGPHANGHCGLTEVPELAGYLRFLRSVLRSPLLLQVSTEGHRCSLRSVLRSSLLPRVSTEVTAAPSGQY